MYGNHMKTGRFHEYKNYLNLKAPGLWLRKMSATLLGDGFSGHLVPATSQVWPPQQPFKWQSWSTPHPIQIASEFHCWNQEMCSSWNGELILMFIFQRWPSIFGDRWQQARNWISWQEIHVACWRKNARFESFPWLSESPKKVPILPRKGSIPTPWDGKIFSNKPWCFFCSNLAFRWIINQTQKFHQLTPVTWLHFPWSFKQNFETKTPNSWASFWYIVQK